MAGRTIKRLNKSKRPEKIHRNRRLLWIARKTSKLNALYITEACMAYLVDQFLKFGRTDSGVQLYITKDQKDRDIVEIGFRAKRGNVVKASMLLSNLKKDSAQALLEHYADEQPVEPDPDFKGGGRAESYSAWMAKREIPSLVNYETFCNTVKRMAAPHSKAVELLNPPKRKYQYGSQTARLWNSAAR